LTRTAFRTTSAGGGLDADSLPMRLYQKAKRFGTWDPCAIDFTRDREDWLALDDERRRALLQLTSLFQAGEEGVTVDLLPLIMVIAREGRLEEELFLTTFLFEEGKHMEFFRRFLDEVCEADDDLSRWHTPSYRRIFYEELPAAMNALADDASPEAQVRASVTYNLIVEGVLAETGYHSYALALERNGLMPGMLEGVGNVKRDEARHIAYGVHLLSRLIHDSPDLWDVAQEQMNELLGPTMSFLRESFEGYEEGVTPFGITLDEITVFASSQFEKRLDRVRRGAAHEEVVA
jgi:ribonucleoside-diphosphate reductase beta chain